MGITRVSFVVTWYQQGPRDYWFGPTADTPTDTALRSAIRAARSLNMEVVLKPHIDLPNDQWRGEITPAEPDKWFLRYNEFITTYADLAAQEGAHTLIIGTELAGTSGDQRWRSTVKTARQRFGGKIVYAANWDEVDRVSFWDLVDELGIDAYYPIAGTGGSTDVETLKRGWTKPLADLRALSIRFRKPIRFTEIGYTRHQGTTNRPYDFRMTTPAAPNEQQAAFDALFAVWIPQPFWAGADIWSADPPREEVDPLGYSPFGQPAQQSISTGAAQVRVRR